MSEPQFIRVDLTDLQDEGVLMAANEQFFWPLGLALTWVVRPVPVNQYIWCKDETIHPEHSWDAPLGHLRTCEGTKAEAADLHVREWAYEDGHKESIALDPDDVVGQKRRERFNAWLLDRIRMLGDKDRA